MNRLISITLLALFSLCQLNPSCAQTAPKNLPPAVIHSLTKAGVPVSALSVFVGGANASLTPLLSYQSHDARQLASVMKTITSSAALDLLGPAFRWETPVWASGTIKNGALQGDLYIKASGDPSIKLGQIYELMAQIRSAGINTIDGNVVIDRSVFNIPYQNPGAFDNAPLEPYNVQPNAFLVNFNTLSFSFTPTGKPNQYYIGMQPPLWGVDYPQTITAPKNCSQFIKTLIPQFNGPEHLQFKKSSCQGEDSVQPGFVGQCKGDEPCDQKTWTLAYPYPSTYALKTVAGVWHQMGGEINGKVIDGNIPESVQKTPPLFRFSSETLTQVLYDINKFSNNLMAKQLFLTLGLEQHGTNYSSTNWVQSQRAIGAWWKKTFPNVEAPVVDNGSGLSRTSKASAFALANLLNHDFNSNYRSEFIASLPILNVDGTLARVKSAFKGRAHMKTGSLKNVISLAGFVRDDAGDYHIVVALINDPAAESAHQALYDIIDWVAQQR